MINCAFADGECQNWVEFETALSGMMTVRILQKTGAGAPIVLGTVTLQPEQSLSLSRLFASSALLPFSVLPSKPSFGG